MDRVHATQLHNRGYNSSPAVEVDKHPKSESDYHKVTDMFQSDRIFCWSETSENHSNSRCLQMKKTWTSGEPHHAKNTSRIHPGSPKESRIIWKELQAAIDRVYDLTRTETFEQTFLSNKNIKTHLRFDTFSKAFGQIFCGLMGQRSNFLEEMRPITSIESNEHCFIKTWGSSLTWWWKCCVAMYVVIWLCCWFNTWMTICNSWNHSFSFVRDSKPLIDRFCIAHF